MSYIRSSSNSEGLYIWSNGTDVEILEGSKFHGRIPVNIFNGLIRKFRKSVHGTPCKFKKCSLDEVWIEGVPKIQLKYGTIEVNMREVTWEYIINSNLKIK